MGALTSIEQRPEIKRHGNYARCPHGSNGVTDTAMTDRAPVPRVELDRAVEVIRGGGVVAFPTETFYGLAVDPFNERALTRLFAVKQRPLDKAILLLIGCREQLSLLGQMPLPESFQLLMDHFWPGPLTIILPARPGLSPMLTGNTGTIGVRMSSHPVAQLLAEAVGGPITATSANLSGEIAACSAFEVRRDLAGLVDYIVDGGGTPGGSGSTIVRRSDDRWQLVRPGVIPYDRILAAKEGGR